MTLGQMLETSTKRYPQKVALLSKDFKINYSQLDNIVNKLANSLIGLGLQKNDRVGLLIQRTPPKLVQSADISIRN